MTELSTSSGDAGLEGPVRKSHSRRTRTVPSAPLEDFMKRHGVTTHQVAEALGMSDAGVHAWRVARKMPSWMHITLVGLRKRMGEEGPSRRPAIFLAQVPPDKADAFEGISNALGVDLMPIKVGE